MAACQGRGTAATDIMLVLLVVVLGASCKAVMATNYVVGDASQWTLGFDYTAWATGKTFVVGDTLEFKYTSAHDVVEVSEADYTGCSKGSNTVYTNGDTNYTLTEAGSTYYICTVDSHCTSGMKVAITISATSATPPTSTPSTPSTPTTPSTPGTTPSTPSSPNTNTTSPSPNSSALSLSPTFFTLFLVVGLSILFFQS